ncbi:RsmB/NOP family class I SAM-dependent RNA methyltransferase [Shewanella marina]|uniref:RsmB/NOP family class I SAM-dependent RNA methyltransferase n=1 Tax=Shewanella marina TaxID=487319 RepID=UPI000472BEB2|nr:RsmB/NOP family class I SAM-dependent RNA methyltransferase [Shewanella marina]
MATTTPILNYSLTIDPIIETQNGNEKRALSYANTIFSLFSYVLNEQKPADKVIAEYFREHKKHGSKDRKVIRESLFALFRWWGWLQQVGQYQQSQDWFKLLTLAATLEQHQWHNIIESWQRFAQIEQLPPAANLTQKQQLVEIVAGVKVTAESLMPAWFWPMVADNCDKTALIESMCTRPPLWLRAQTSPSTEIVKQLNQAGFDADINPSISTAISLGHQAINLNEIDCYKKGQVEVQDLASQVIGYICQPQTNEQWWDTCSGAGGKTLQLASILKQQNANAKITASDIRPFVLQELLKRAKRAGFKGITTKPWTSEALPVDTQFDGVLVDAPCSCTGTWRRNPDMRWLDTPESLQHYPELQLDILSRSAKAVKNGGKLVYATCSLASNENEQVITQFLANNPEFELMLIIDPLTQTQQKMLTVYPYTQDSDGMFVCCMVKQK